jgi:hypothetical protein
MFNVIEVILQLRKTGLLILSPNGFGPQRLLSPKTGSGQRARFDSQERVS